MDIDPICTGAAVAGEPLDRIAQAMQLLTIDRGQHPASSSLPNEEELAAYQDPEAALSDAIQMALRGLHKLVLARKY